MIDPQTLYEEPNALAPDYGRFRVSERLLLTGHSHQAWPDVAFRGQKRAWLDAAERVDEKWERAFERAERVRRGWARLLDDPAGHIALAPNTHDLLIRFLSALPLKGRTRIVTTDGEFHTIRRQTDRLAEEGMEVVRVASDPADGVSDALVQAVDDRTAAVLVSSVLYRNAHIVPGLGEVASACLRSGAELLVDAYHSLNVVPFSVRRQGLSSAFVVGGGYKYCQLGEGNCFLRFPPECRARPVITGWFAEFGTLSEPAANGGVRYPDGPDRFAGSTYEPTSHYRAAEVFDFFETRELTPEALRRVSRHQIERLAERFDALDTDPELITRDRDVPLEEVGGFLALHSPRAGRLSARLRERGVRTDHRDELLRLGPAPYLSDAQLDASIEALAEVIEEGA